MRSFIFILLAALFLGSAAYLGNQYLFDRDKNIGFPPTLPKSAADIWALRLVTDVSKGAILDKSMVEWGLIPSDRDGAPFLKMEQMDLTNWQGAVFTRSLKKDVFLKDTHFIRPYENGYHKALLGEGMRVRPVTIENLDDFEGLLPGDYVDLILTYVTPPHAVRSGETVVRTILEKNRVIALEADGGKSATGGKSTAKPLSLALSPEDVELVSMAEAVGELRIALHGGAVSGKTEKTTKKAEISASDLFPNLKPAPAVLGQTRARDIRIMRGGETSVVTLTPPVGK
ncbi:Flp pilus assembly protein CpaB [Sneathiella litorea]|uniref:Flp pilus assembly protein CpaB n=1 Tax=Sneathiella litorea TaxID=2606216 RepID=A0A6L8WAW2_9PROT|nr:Flp pilus assembly protein CpaB [Sneathiella litorea]MZR31814.1 Flp pilus assembly protein CpaB [Sneathiella litorea]